MTPDLTEQNVDDIGTPILGFAAVSLIAAQVDAAGGIDADIFAGLSRWPSGARADLLADCRREAERVRDWAYAALAALDGVPS